MKKLLLFRIVGMAFVAVLMCMNLSSCSNDDDETVDKEDLSSYYKTSLKVNGKAYLVRLEYSYYTPDMWANISSSQWGAEFGVNGVREDGLTVMLNGSEIPTPLSPNTNIGKYTKLWCCLWDDIGSDYKYNSGKVTVYDNGNGLSIKFDYAVYKLVVESHTSEELKKHSEQILNGTIQITEDKIYREN